MISKNQIKFVKSLKQKKFILENKLFIAEGTKIVPELLNSNIVVKQVYGSSDFFRKVVIDKDVERFEIKANELERISSLTNPNEVLAVCEVPRRNFKEDAFKDKLTLVLDDIKDPGNLGTIIRIADWFGIESIICSEETAYAFNPKVVQATMGSIARVELHYKNLNDFFSSESFPKGDMQTFGALLDGENIYSKKLPANGFIVMGNESNGISEVLLPHISDKILIPSYSHIKAASGGEAESLNAAIATSIICSEFRRQSGK